MEEYKLYAVWHGTFDSRNVYRVVGNIEFSDGRAKFKIANGSNVDIEVEKLIEIGIVKAEE